MARAGGHERSCSATALNIPPSRPFYEVCIRTKRVRPMQCSSRAGRAIHLPNQSKSKGRSGFQYRTVQVQYLQVDRDALADALGDGAIALEAAQYAIEVLESGSGYAELQRGLHRQYPHPSFGIAADFGDDLAAHWIGGLLELSQREQQRIAETVADCSAEQLHRRRTEAAAKWGRLIGGDSRYRGAEVDLETVVLLLFQQNGDVVHARPFEWV